MPAGIDQAREADGKFAYDGGPKKAAPKGGAPRGGGGGGGSSGGEGGESKGGGKTKAPKTSAPSKVTGNTHADIKAAGGNPELAQGYIQAWRTSGVSKPALQYRASVAKASGLDVTHDADRLASRMLESKAEAHETLSAVSKKAGKEQVATAKAMASVSQGHYAEENVTLYRGISNQQAGELRESLKSGKGSFKTDQVTSFTESREIASNFAKGGAVITMKVPRSAILASHRAHPEFGEEKEVLVASHGGWDVSAGDVEFK